MPHKDTPLTRAETFAVIRAGQASFPQIPHACEKAAQHDEAPTPVEPVDNPRRARATVGRAPRRRRRPLPLFDRIGYDLAACAKQPG